MVQRREGLRIHFAGGDWRTGTPLWTIDIGKTPVTSVELGRDGRLLLLAAGDTAEILDVSSDDRPAAELEVFSACRTGYVVERGRLARVEPDLATSAGLR